MQEFQNNFRDKGGDYGNIRINKKEEVQCIMEGILIIAVFAYFFYRSYLALIFLSPILYFYRVYKKKRIIKERISSLEQQFKETILIVQINLQAGYSIENAFVESYQDIVKIFGDHCYMAKELEIIRKGLRNGKTLESLLTELGRKCPDSEIEEFARVYSIACKTGNQWKEVISKTVFLITQKIEIKEEIEILIHGKKTENRIMCVIPFFILLYMDLTSKGYFDVLYHNVLGIVVMTICMMIYILAYLLSEKITEIE